MSEDILLNAVELKLLCAILKERKMVREIWGTGREGELFRAAERIDRLQDALVGRLIDRIGEGLREPDGAEQFELDLTVEA